MAKDTEAPVDLYVAAYLDADAARDDWDAIKELADAGDIKVEGLILVSRGTDGKISVKDDFHTTGKGAAWGAVGGAIVGLIFPPSMLAGALVGAGAGAGVGGLISHGEKSDIKDDVKDSLPVDSSGIVAMFDDEFAAAVAKALGKASTVSRNQVDPTSAKALTDAVKSA